MKNLQYLLLFLAITCISCEAHLDVSPGQGGLFCDCTDVNFRWEATDQNDEPLENIKITTPSGVEDHPGSGTYSLNLCESHTFILEAKNSSATDTWELAYTKIDGPRDFTLSYTCNGFYPILDENPLPSNLMEQLKVTRMCNSYRHKSITVRWDSWSFEIPAGGCIETGTQCNNVDFGDWQQFQITSGPIIAPGITREDCDPRGEVSPPPGVINPGNLGLRLTAVCECPT